MTWYIRIGTGCPGGADRLGGGTWLVVAFYPDDDRFLVDRETTVSHYELLTE